MSSPGNGTDDGKADVGDDASEGPNIHDESPPSSPVERSPPPDTDSERPDQWRSRESTGPPAQRANGPNETSEWRLFAYDLASSVLAVMVVGAYLFAISGVWPPLVAVESKSMVPNMEVNDLVFVMDEERFPGAEAHAETGVVTARAADNYRKFGQRGDVIIFAPRGNDGVTPIIHRAMFWVEEGENWYDSADKDYVGGADGCETDEDPSTDTGLQNCPAPHDGFITKGDNNGLYDQAGRGGAQSGPIKPEWVVGTAEFRVPGLGWIRLATQ